MNEFNNQYEIAQNCYTGEIDGYGYAFVPGSSFGVVLLDFQTKRLLDNISVSDGSLNQERINLLLEKRLIRRQNDPVRPLVLNQAAVKSIDTWLHVANCCNLSCPYCYIADKQPNEFMSLLIADSYLDKLEETVSSHGLKLVSVRFAGGEPTLNKKIVYHVIGEIKRRFIDKGIAVKTTLITNGTNLNSGWLKLMRSNSMGLCVSLDGIGSWHDRSRFFKDGKGSFEVVIRNIDFCREQGVNPTILTTVTEENLGGLPSLFGFLVDNNFSFRLGVYRDNVGGYRGYVDFINRLKDVLRRCYAYYVDSIRNNGKIFSHRFSDIQLDRKPHLRCCGVGYSSVVVDHRGQVFLCQAGMDKPSIGTIHDNRTLLEMAWSQKTFPELQDKTVFDYDDCRECQWALVCGGGCHTVKKNAWDSVTKASPYCDLFKFVIPKIIELKALYLISNLKKGGGNGIGNPDS